MLRMFIVTTSIALLALSGCAKDDTLRTEGLTLGAGDAIATNSALQIIDPWPEGVEDTDLLVPSASGATADAPASGGTGAVTAPPATTGVQ
jgi:hypothetical protein